MLADGKISTSQILTKQTYAKHYDAKQKEKESEMQTISVMVCDNFLEYLDKEINEACR